MSKAEIIQEIAKLTAEERAEILDVLWTLEEQHTLGSSAPTANEKALLDQELDELEKAPWQGSSWKEVKARLDRPA